MGCKFNCPWSFILIASWANLDHSGTLTLHQLHELLSFISIKSPQELSKLLSQGTTRHPTFTKFIFFCKETTAFLSPYTCITSLKSWLPLQGNFKDIILIFSHEPCANQKKMNNISSWWQSWNWSPDSWSVTALWCLLVLLTGNKDCCTSRRHMLARKHTDLRVKSHWGTSGWGQHWDWYYGNSLKATKSDEGS